MSSLTNNAPFSLNAINLRKELVFPDGTIQSTAYTGAVGGPTLAEVLADGNNANGIGIVELPFIHINDGDDSSVITQSGTTLAIQSGGDTTFGGTANSILSLQVTTSNPLVDYEAINITDARVLVNPQLQLGTSIEFPDTSVQTSAPRYFDYIENNITVVTIPNGFGNPNNTLNVISLPNLTVEGQYFVQFSINLSTVGTVTNMICREGFVALLGQIATDFSVPYQYPNVDAYFGFIGAGSVFISGSIIFNTLVPNVSGAVLNLTCGWGGAGSVNFENATAMITYIGSSTGAV